MSLCSWITGFLAPRQTKKCFGTTLVIEAELASTQISNVSLVHHQDELCALKVICFDQAKKAIVEREAAAQRMAQSHENVLSLLKDEVTSTANADVLELRLLFQYCPGGTLAEALEAQPAGLVEATALAVFVQYAAAIAHCHTVGVTHRDLKLTNIYREGVEAELGASRWLLADFGSAEFGSEREVDSRELLAAAREEVTELTTPEYRAPEQVALELGSTLGPQVDVWALGVALHQTCFGANPFATPLATLSDRAPTDAEIACASTGLRKLLDATLCRDVGARATAREACNAARDLLSPANADGWTAEFT